MPAPEMSFVMVKPDGVQRGLVGEVISRLERKGFKLAGLKLMRPSRQLLEEHYENIKTRSFFPGFIDFMNSGPVVAMCWEGLEVVPTIRQIIGDTNPLRAAPGTIRGDCCIDPGRNLIHASDSTESAVKELALWFSTGELQEYKKNNHPDIYEN